MKLGIIGSRGHLHVVMSALKEMDDVEVVAAARWGKGDPLAFTAEPQYAGVPIYDDYRVMLDKETADVAAVFVPFAELATAATAAAEHNCHVFMEKPLATTHADLARLREAVYTAGVQAVGCFAMRGKSAYLTIRKAVAAGRIGKVIYATAQKSYPFADRDEFYATRESYGGTIPWVAIHALDYLSWCTGQDYRRVAAVGSNLAHPSRPGLEDAGGILAELTGGGAAVLNFDYFRPWGKLKRIWGDDRLRIAGTDGIIETKDSGTAVELMTPDATEMLPLEEPVNIFTEFVAGLRGEKEPFISTEDSFRITEVALKARDAQDTGKFIEV